MQAGWFKIAVFISLLYAVSSLHGFAQIVKPITPVPITPTPVTPVPVNPVPINPVPINPVNPFPHIDTITPKPKDSDNRPDHHDSTIVPVDSLKPDSIRKPEPIPVQVPGKSIFTLKTFWIVLVLLAIIIMFSRKKRE